MFITQKQVIYINKKEIIKAVYQMEKKRFIFNFGVEILPSTFLDLHYNENLLRRNVSIT